MISDELAVDIEDDVADSKVDFFRRRILENLGDGNLLPVVSPAFDRETEARVNVEPRSRNQHFPIFVRPRIYGF
jgi:hypothetical protein